MAKTVIALYDEMEDARQVVEELTGAGFDREEINLIASDYKGEYAAYLGEEETAEDIQEDAVEGAEIGGVVGGIAGLLVGLSVFVAPGLGPLVIAGPILTTLAGAGTGAAAGGLIDALTDLGVPAEHAGIYAEGVKRGGVLISMVATNDRAAEAVQIMDRHNPVDLHHRVSIWEEAGWKGFDPEAEPYDPGRIDRERARYGS